jgi:hypothetical protein
VERCSQKKLHESPGRGLNIGLPPNKVASKISKKRLEAMALINIQNMRQDTVLQPLNEQNLSSFTCMKLGADIDNFSASVPIFVPRIQATRTW